MEDLLALYQYIRRNIDGLATLLATAYNATLSANLSEAEKHQILKTINRIERTINEKGGEIEDFINAIQTGANKQPMNMKGLGVVAETVGGSATVASIIALINQVDWDNLSQVWKKDNTPSDGGGNNIPGSPAPMPYAPQTPDYKQNKPLQNGGNTQAGSNKIMWLLGTLIVAGSGLYYWKTQQKTQTTKPKQAK